MTKKRISLIFENYIKYIKIKSFYFIIPLLLKVRHRDDLQNQNATCNEIS